MGFRSVVSTVVRCFRDDPIAAQGALDCVKTASQPLSQIQWPVHTSLHRLDGVLGRRGCGHDEPNPFPRRRARDRAVQARRPEHRLSLLPQRHDADLLSVQVVGNGAGADAVPRPHLQARQAGEGPDQRTLPKAVDLGSSRSSSNLTERRRQVIRQMQKFFEANKFHGLSHPRVTNHRKGTFGVFAEFGDLNKGTKTGGVEEINLAQIKHRSQFAGLEYIAYVVHELLLGVSVQLPGEMKDQATTSLFETSAERNSQSLKFADWINPPAFGTKCSDPGGCQPRADRRSSIRDANRAK